VSTASSRTSWTATSCPTSASALTSRAPAEETSRCRSRRTSWSRTPTLAAALRRRRLRHGPRPRRGLPSPAPHPVGHPVAGHPVRGRPEPGHPAGVHPPRPRAGRRALIMTVTPGFGGQAYLHTMEPKVAEGRRLIERSRLPTLIEVDGHLGHHRAGRGAGWSTPAGGGFGHPGPSGGEAGGGRGTAPLPAARPPGAARRKGRARVRHPRDRRHPRQPEGRVRVMAYQGAIFDVDAVLVDSPHELAWRESLRMLMEGSGARSATRRPGRRSASPPEVYQQVMAGEPRMAGALGPSSTSACLPSPVRTRRGP
jgi:Ribulose-phosphate 3 epimerase family